MKALLERWFGNDSSKRLAEIKPLIERINQLEPSIVALSDSELAAQTPQLKARLAAGETLDDILPDAFAVVREAAKRQLGERHYDVQLIGGVVLHQRGIAEMRTGEGKTLVGTLPVYLNALTGRGVHVVTVNDYLSRRDAVWMGQVYDFLGLSVGVINHESSFVYDKAHTEKDAERDASGSFRVVHEFLRPATRRQAYEADITYGTNTEFGFDYLRDNLERDAAGLRQRPFYFAVVDEVDSILIDEARTPLIISGPTTDSEQLYKTFADLAASFDETTDYVVDEKQHAITLTDAGITKAEKALNVENIYTEGGVKYVHHLETAVRARALYRRDKEYVVRDGKVIIVDPYTGRLQPGRRWSEGLHQAIEAKEGVVLEKESRTYASITYQNYFKLYEKLAGMTGTAYTSREEFLKVYGLSVVPIPTNKPIARVDKDDLIFQSEHGKFLAVARRVKELHATGRPVLIGTVSIEKNELLSKYLSAEGVPHEILNAKNHEREGEIIAQAGKKGAVTIATNMAGRGVDIKLGGSPYTREAADEVRALGGLAVMGTERHDARRIDNQLRGRSGRQGDPGETQFFVSLDDHLMRVFAKDIVKRMMGRFGIPEDEPIQNRIISKSLESAQTKIEGFHFDARKHVLEFDNVLNHQRTIVYARRRDMLLGTDDDARRYLDAALRQASDELVTAVREREAAMAPEVFFRGVRQIVLQVTDMLWVEHLEAMDYLRGSVNLRAYGQRDPLVEYKREGLRMFKDMEQTAQFQVLSTIASASIAAAPQAASIVPPASALKEIREGADSITAETRRGDAAAARANDPYAHVGRNDECPCGSGKKFKKCHGA